MRWRTPGRLCMLRLPTSTAGGWCFISGKAGWSATGMFHGVQAAEILREYCGWMKPKTYCFRAWRTTAGRRPRHTKVAWTAVTEAAKGGRITKRFRRTRSAQLASAPARGWCRSRTFSSCSVTPSWLIRRSICICRAGTASCRQPPGVACCLDVKRGEAFKEACEGMTRPTLRWPTSFVLVAATSWSGMDRISPPSTAR